jgi:hypothetical protein
VLQNKNADVYGWVFWQKCYKPFTGWEKFAVKGGKQYYTVLVPVYMPRMGTYQMVNYLVDGSAIIWRHGGPTETETPAP